MSSILHIGNTPDDIQRLKESLRNFGFLNELIVLPQLQHAYEFFNTLNLKQKNSPDIPSLILIDASTVGRELLDLLQRVRTLNVGNEIPCVVFVSSREERALLEQKQFDAIGYIVKPVDIFEFLAVASDIGCSFTLSFESSKKSDDKGGVIRRFSYA